MKLTEKVLSHVATNYVHLRGLDLVLTSTLEIREFLKAIEKGNSSLETLKLTLNNTAEDDEEVSIGDQLVLTTFGELLGKSMVPLLKSLSIEYLNYTPYLAKFHGRGC